MFMDCRVGVEQNAISLIYMNSTLGNLVRRFRLYNIGKKEVVVSSREVYKKLILWKSYFAYSYCIKFVLSYLGAKIIENTIKSYYLAALCMAQHS